MNKNILVILSVLACTQVSTAASVSGGVSVSSTLSVSAARVVISTPSVSAAPVVSASPVLPKSTSGTAVVFNTSSLGSNNQAILSIFSSDSDIQKHIQAKVTELRSSLARACSSRHRFSLVEVKFAINSKSEKVKVSTGFCQSMMEKCRSSRLPKDLQTLLLNTVNAVSVNVSAQCIYKK